VQRKGGDLMLYAVDLTIEAEKTLIIEADSKAEAARIARRQELGRKHLLEEGEFIVICCTNGTRELKGSAK
jgi:hypothetical protein